MFYLNNIFPFILHIDHCSPFLLASQLPLLTCPQPLLLLPCLLSLLTVKPLCATRLAKHGLYISVSKNFQDSWQCSPSLLPHFPLPCHRPSILYSKSTTSPGRLDRKQTPRMVSNQVFLYQLKQFGWLSFVVTRHQTSSLKKQI